MTLVADSTRCLGLLPGPTGEIPCTKRETCARYVERHDGAPMAQYLCPTLDEFYGAYVEVKG
jgi:hypothetical protein